MTHETPTMDIAGWNALLNRVAKEGDRIVIEVGGEPKAALVSVEDAELLERIEDYLDGMDAKAALAEPGEDIPWEAVKKALNL